VVLLGTVGGNPAVLGTAYLYGTGTGSLGVVIPGNESTAAGNDNFQGSVNDGQPATQAELYLPTSIVLDGAGNLYIADSAHNRIRMVCGASATATISGTSCTGAGIISTIAGNGTAGTSPDGPASTSVLNTPSGLAVDGAGNLYVADTGNNIVREIVAATGQIVTVAGGATAVCGLATDTVGDGCPALQATLNQPEGVTLDPAGNLYIADTADARVREVALSTGNIVSVAGDGTPGYNGDNITAITAELDSPYAVAFDGAGNLYIPDSGNNRVRLVAAVSGSITPASLITTFAGTGVAGDAGDAGAATNAELWAPSGLALDAAGNVYLADTNNNAIRKVNSATAGISTLVQDGVGTLYSGGAFSPVTLNGPMGIALDSSGNLYIADALDMEVRQIQSNLIALNYTAPVFQGATSPSMPVTMENDGNAALDLTAINPLADAAVDAVTTTCNTGAPNLAVSNDCIVGAELAPTAAANPLITDIDLTSATVNSPLDIKLVGIALASNATTTTVTSAPDPSNFGQAVAFTVTVATGAGSGNLTGTVSIADTFNGATTVLASGLALNTSDIVTFSTGALAVGQHSIVATYGGDSGHLSSTSTEYGVPPLIQTVLEQTTTTLAPSLNPSAVGQNVTFTATVAVSSAGGGVTPTGTVTFLDGSTVLGTSTLSTTGSVTSATYTTNALTAGLHPITAVYNGNTATDVEGSTSNIVDQDVQATATVGLVSSPNPSTYGATVTFTATITSAAPGPATGTVTFFDGTNQIGSGTLAGNPAAATFATATLAVGTHPITAQYAGDNYNSAGTSPVVSQVVNPAVTTTVVTSAPNPSNFGQNVTFTINVTTGVGTGNLTGTVSLADTFNGVTTTIATGLPLNLSGIATFSTTTLAVGQHSIVATYGGDTDHATSSSAAGGLIQVVDEVTAVALTSSQNPSTFGQNVTFTAAVSISGGGGVAPTGTVTFMDGATALSTVPLTAAGTAVYATATLAIGVHPITAVYSGAASSQVLGSTSAVLNQDVQAASTVALASSLNPSTYGATVTFTATVTSGAPSAPTGAVNFFDGTTQIGSGLLSGTTATATFATATLAVGTHSITAVYAGDSNNSAATSPVVSQMVNQAPSATQIASSLNPSLFSQTVTFTVTVSAGVGTGPLTGTVTIADTFNGVVTNLATALPINASGVVTFETAALAVGQHSIVATYSGDTDHAGSASSPPLIQVVDETTATTLTSSANPSLFGQSVTFTATVAATGGGGVAPDGTVTFMDGAAALGTAPVNAGVATFNTATLAVGLHPITAVYGGDAAKGINPSTSAVLSQDVQAVTTATVASSLNPSNFGQAVTFTATIASNAAVAPTGTVAFLDAGKQIGTGTLSGNPAVATFTTASLAAGTHPITVSYAGDANNAAIVSAPALNQVVNLAQTTTTVTASPNPGIAQEPVTITATVKVTAGIATPTGTVTFTSGTTVLGTGTLNGATATITPILAAGTYQVVATYSGDTDDAGSASSALSLVINPATSTTILTVSPNPAVVGATITFTANVVGNGVAPTGTVSFLSGTAVLGTSPLSASGVASFSTATLAVGNYAITASYSGDANNGASTSEVVGLTVSLIPTTTSLSVSTPSNANGQTVLTAVVIGTTGPTPTGTVTFANGGTILGSVPLDSSGVATLSLGLPNGNYLIVAGYGGDSIHAPSASAPVQIAGAPPSFTITAPGAVTLKTSQNTTVTVTLTAVGAFADNIGLGCGSLPAGVSCLFATNPLALAANGTASTQLTIDTNTPFGGGGTARNGQGPKGVSLAGIFLPLSVFFGWLLWRLRRRSMSLLTLVLVLAISAGALLAAGCSGYSSKSAAPGTYVIQVTGTGINTGVIEYQNVKLTITN